MPNFSVGFLISELHDLLRIPEPTIRDYVARLRKAPDLFSRGTQGRPPPVTTAEVVNIIIALCAGTSHTRANPDPIETVRKIRQAPLSEASVIPPGVLDGLRVGQVATAGDVLDSLLADMRSGAYDKWAGVGYGEKRELNDMPLAIVTIRFRTRETIVNIYKGRDPVVLIFKYELHLDDLISALTIERSLDGSALQQIAHKMGPPLETE